MTWTRFSARTVRYDPLAGVFQPPGEATIRRVLETVDAAALDAAVGSWLTAPLGAGRAVRAPRHASADGQAAHLLAVADQEASAVLAQVDVDGKPMRSPASSRCWQTWTWLKLSSPPTRSTPSETTPCSWWRKRRPTTSSSPKTTSPASAPSSRTCPGAASPPAAPEVRPRPRPRRAPHPQGHFRRTRAVLPPRRPGHPGHPPPPALREEEIVPPRPSTPSPA